MSSPNVFDDSSPLNTDTSISSTSSSSLGGEDFIFGKTASGEECTCRVSSSSAGSTSISGTGNEDDESESIVVKRTSCDKSEDGCRRNCVGIHVKDKYLQDKCCVHVGQSANLLAFEEDDTWIARIAEFNKCTGAKVKLEYLPEGEDGMADAIITDLGLDPDLVSYDSSSNTNENGNGNNNPSSSGEGIFDAYIIQAPWVPPVANGLENLTPLIREYADTVRFLDINAASRSAMSYNGTVRALPLDSDYIALGWRHDVFHKYDLEVTPPKTIQELANLAEFLNGKDHNGDGEPDWGVCLTPQVNYFYAFVAPLLQTTLIDPMDGTETGQNMFFSADTFEPLIRVPAFREALELYYRIILSSNCQDQLPKGEKCDRKTAFPTGRCAMVISMPGTLTKMLLNGSKYSPKQRLNDVTGEVEWDINDQPLGVDGKYWGRRARFPGSSVVQLWDKSQNYTLVDCDSDPSHCPNAEGGINYAPFFAEGGEAYAINGKQSKKSARKVMWDMFAWLSELPVTELPLSGQYRKSHLGEEHRVDLTTRAGWPEQMVDDLFDVLGKYFLDNGNAVQDLLMLGFKDYMGALNEELHDKLLGVLKDSGRLFNRTDPSRSVSIDSSEFDVAFMEFVDQLESRYNAITNNISGGPMAQLQRWRQSLNLPWRSASELCVDSLGSGDVPAFQRLQCPAIVDFDNLCQARPEDVAKHNPTLCADVFGYGLEENGNNKVLLLVPSILVPLVVIIAIFAYVYNERKKRLRDAIWAVKPEELKFDDPPTIVGRGTFGLVLLAEYRGTNVAVKRVIPPKFEFAGAGAASVNNSGKLSGSGFRRSILGEGDFVNEDSPDTDRTENIDGDTNSDDNNKCNNDNEKCNDNCKHNKSGSFHLSEKFNFDANPTGPVDEESGLPSKSGLLDAKASGGSSSGNKVMKRSVIRSLPSNLISTLRPRSEYEKLKQDFISEMRYLAKLRHPCITTVMGAVTAQGEEPMLVMEFCDYGSLYDVLHNETMPLDGDIILPILRDIAQGIRFLHAANPQVIHGDLKAANILVDRRFRAKVADFGLSQKSAVGATGTPLWMAPELLRGESGNTTASDVYSFGIILYEVFSRKDPYHETKDLNYRVLMGKITDPKISLRPPVPSGMPPLVATIMKESLVDDASLRPPFEELDMRLKRLDSENVEPGENCFTSYYKRKESKTNQLLYDVFPPHIADALREGRKVEQETHDCITIFFSDIVGFTTVSQTIGPNKVANMLDRLYNRFDELSQRFDIFKIETIGDAYMASTNLVKRQPDDHVLRIAQFSLAAIAAAEATPLDEDDLSMGNVRIRVGFHCGPVIADVVGSRLPKYGVFGDTVNTASRMESNSLPGRVHCSDVAAKLLNEQLLNLQNDSLMIIPRGEIHIKGKGMMTTFWVDPDDTAGAEEQDANLV